VQALALGRDGSHRRAALRALDALPGQRVLDVGCGTGRNFPRLRDCRLFGVDVSARSLRKATARGACAAQCDAERLPFPDASFDRVLSTYVLTSVADWRRAFAEMVRVLRPGGRLALTDDRLPPGWFLGPGPMIRLWRERGWVDEHRAVVREAEAALRNVRLEFRHLRMIYLVFGEKPA
jgi:ubiquinone/menaquinone biosynthesis C-methylase UbiE